MPELPDITVYIEALESRIQQHSIVDIKLQSPFLLRTAEIPLTDLIDRKVTRLQRIGKRIAIGFDDYWLIFHLMIAGRLHWKDSVKKMPGKSALIILKFDNGILYLTEAGKKKRASLHVVRGEEAVAEQDPGGKEIAELDLEAFSNLLTHTNHTLKRVLTDPRIYSGIGNAYSDEILHRAGLSPIKQSQKLSSDEIETLYSATKDVLVEWTDRLRNESGDNFPEKVTAFRSEMMVHGRFGKNCPVCQTIVQRIRYASNETNYCPRCQTDGKLLADRSLSRLLKKDWPKTIEELERKKS
ncbi:Fpg/Nei family DNA glycosylase [Aliikangiella coralliicola]|uniref:Formamidopyrimidine-DNA glycosylase n=1 Tax=Aliikangiella coralliicola TaxID=2592383 RepID=A0A545UHQ9_9GAMM|nr:DNA-formamidopyrimidine glycosylase family protein [Aliikangiella coralliicola]TQV89005.1 formamidopyrimidine-DNA glycosylase [Aliikangiella coralliicola]